MKITFIMAAGILTVAAPATASDDTGSLAPVVVLPAGTKLTDGRALVEPLSTDQAGTTTVRVVDATGKGSELDVDVRLDGEAASAAAGSER